MLRGNAAAFLESLLCLSVSKRSSAMTPIRRACRMWDVCQGWYVRSGIIYGADFVVYRRHPSCVHAEYGVSVLSAGTSLSLNDIQATYRLLHQARHIITDMHR